MKKPRCGAVELADSLKNEPVQFIAVTDEDEATVRSFLASHPIHGWIGLNTTGSMIKSYGIHTGNAATDAERPLTVVIRPDGIVDARLRPYAIPFPMTAQNLINLAGGKSSGLVSSRITFAGLVRDSMKNPMANATVRAAEIISVGTWRQIGDEVMTDQNGRFKIDQEQPMSYFSGYPIVLDVAHAGYLDGRVEDLRSMSAAQRQRLCVTLKRPGE